MAKDERKEVNRYRVAAIPTQTELVIRDTENKDQETRDYTIPEALVKIMNDIEELKSLL